MNKVLIVDDEQRMLDLIALYLEPHNYQCKKAQGASKALSCIEAETYDIVLLDIMMPGMDGWQLCQQIRRFSDVPIIMLTARDQREDIVKGLQLGADDYVTKPFDEDELLARMSALLRRRTPRNFVEINGLRWNEEQFTLTYKNEMIKLTPKEFILIGYFMKKPNQVFERDQLIDLIWGYHSETESRTIDSHVRNMRDKIRQAGFPIDDHFKTVWGVGYKWVNINEN